MDLSDRLIQEVLAFFVASHDFNGLIASAAQERLGVTPPELLAAIRSLVERQAIVLAFSSHQDNPHVLRLPPPAQAEQVALLQTADLDEIGLYPSRQSLLGRTDLATFDEVPFTRRLALGEPQLTPLFFELRVLDQYYRDPRYSFEFLERSGRIIIRDGPYESESTPDRDKVILDSFGIGYDPAHRRVVAAFLRYLRELPAAHQAIWTAHQVFEPCTINSDYGNALLFGAMPRFHSAYAAVLAEMVEISKLSILIGKPSLFRETWEEQRPSGFHPMLRSTARSLQDFVHLLDKMLSENIDRDFFKGDVDLEETTERQDGQVAVAQLGTLTLLERWLARFYRTADGEDISAKVLAPFKTVRKLRQKPAHSLTEDSYDEGLPQQQDDLIREIVAGLSTLRLALTSHPKAKGNYSPPPWLDGDQIVFY